MELSSFHSAGPHSSVQTAVPETFHAEPVSPFQIAASPFQSAAVSQFQTEEVETGMWHEAAFQCTVAASRFHSGEIAVSPFQTGGVVGPGDYSWNVSRVSSFRAAARVGNMMTS